MKLNFITFMVRDLDRSIAFYRDLAGLKVLRQLSPGPGKIAFLGNAEGETMLELVSFEGAPTVSTQAMTLSFSAEGPRLEELRETALTLGFAPSEIIQDGPKPAHFTVIDPDGVQVEFL